MITKLQQNWFYLLLPVLMLIAYKVSITPMAQADPQTLEQVLLADALISIPVLYFLYLKSRFPLKQVVIRCLAIAGAGLWFAGWLMPSGEGNILPWLGWLRTFALPLFLLIEFALIISVVRYTFAEDANPQQLVEKGMPEWVAKAMIWEARFWKAAYRLLTGRNDDRP